MNQRIINYTNLTRLSNPIGIALLFLPCLFGIFLALKKTNLNFFTTIWIIFLFGLGSVIMRSAGCVINDILDLNFDRQVFRTKNRPLAAQKINRLEALMLLTLLLLIGFLILLQFNIATIISGFFALTLAATYPLMKRITYYPQIFLGMAFNFGIIMASLTILDRIDLSFVVLYLAAIIWTLIYDTIYAYQDIEDDLRIGVKSSAIKFAKNPKIILLSLTFVMFCLIFFVGSLENLSQSYFLLNLGAFAFLAQKIMSCNFNNPQNCLKVFRDNFWVGVLILTAIFFS